MRDLSASNAQVARQWRSVRSRIERINSDVESIRQELMRAGDLESEEVFHRLEALQEKFEKVMGQLSGFDDGGEEIIRDAKEDFRVVVRRYQLSRLKTSGEKVH